MLHGPIWNKIPRFALPVAATAILEQPFNASDIAVVGNFTGAERTAAVAAVGANSSIIGLIVNLFIGIALGANVVIARAIGHGDRETVTEAVHTSILVSVLGGTMVALCLTEGIITLAAAIAVILFFGKQLPAIFNSDPKVVSTGYIRLVMVMLSHLFSLLYDVMSGYLRGFGISLAPALLTILGVYGIRIA